MAKERHDIDSPEPLTATHQAPATAADQPLGSYRPPALTELGTLEELTLGGVDGSVPDGWGTAGFEGSI